MATGTKTRKKTDAKRPKTIWIAPSDWRRAGRAARIKTQQDGVRWSAGTIIIRGGVKLADKILAAAGHPAGIAQ